ncbi:hypothetical protein BGZ63DRAFT_475035 [Mariannaea sp. PMI_226]|nr:hypothetical protein BGZ63DRAFT_475035 [Mariannaea sp. PMI_226]
MSSTAFSHNAAANQANHSSSQINGNIGHQMRIHNAYFHGSRGSPIESPSPVSPSDTGSFYFGPIPTLEEGQNSDGESEPIGRPRPTIKREDVEYISNMSIKILQEYKTILRRTARVKAKRIRKLRQKAMDQILRINSHVKDIKKWSKFPANPQHDNSTTLVLQETTLDSSVIQRTDDLKSKLGDICGKLNAAVKVVARIHKRSKDRRGEHPIKCSELIEDFFSDLVEDIELDIAAIESQVYQLSVCHSPFETKNGFDQLYVSSSASRTLYRHLCQACPLSGQVQGHGHTALVGLVPVPEKEPFCIAPDQVARTGHHVAIESTFHKGDYIWFEAHSRLLLPGSDNEAVYSPSSPQSAVIDGLRKRSRRDSGYSSASGSTSREQIQLAQRRLGSSDFCRIQVCPGSLAQGSDRLAMCIGDDQESGHQILYLDETKRPKTSCEPLNLAKIIQQWNETPSQRDSILVRRSKKLRDDRFKLALKIAEATLLYGWMEWLGDAWGIRDIEFYPVESERMPFLRAQMFNYGCGRLERFMFNLGFVLLQLGLWEQLRPCMPGPMYDTELGKELNRLGTETGTAFQEAVRYCMWFARSSDGDLEDNDIFQVTFYLKVISPLREMAMRMDNPEC